MTADQCPQTDRALPTEDRTLLVTHPEVTLSDGADHRRALVWHTREGWELEVGPATAELLTAFALPRTVGSVTGPGGSERTRQAVRALRERGLLVRYEPDGVPTPRGRGGMFDTPVLSLAEALRGDSCAVVFVGMPYDLGVTHRPGARFAPAYLRRTSGALYQYRDGEGGPAGAVDPVTGRRLLAGVRMADTGDVSATVHRPGGPTFAALESVTAKTAAAGRLPVVLGGDHSITLPVVRGLATSHGEIGVLHIDAHSDYARPRDDDVAGQCHHGNVMDWVVGDPRVARLAQFGIRQLEASPGRPDTTLVRWPGLSAVHQDPGAVLADLPEHLPYHLTVDVDALDPAVLPATGTPLPGGFSHEQLVRLLTTLCSNRRVVGIDVVELLPGSAETDGLIVNDVLLRALDAATRAPADEGAQR